MNTIRIRHNAYAMRDFFHDVSLRVENAYQKYGDEGMVEFNLPLEFIDGFIPQLQEPKLANDEAQDINAATNMRTEFDPKWPHGHVTRRGDPVRILATDARMNDRICVLALATMRGVEVPMGYDINGRTLADRESPDDVINAPRRIKGSVVLYRLAGTEGIQTVFVSDQDNAMDVMQAINCDVGVARAIPVDVEEF